MEASEAMRCCENCFDEEHLKNRIHRDGVEGNCDYCGAMDVFTIEPRKLYNEFEGLLALYEPTAYGEHYHKDLGTEAIDVGEQLPQAISDDWGFDIFNWNALKEETQQSSLLDEIRKGSPDYDYKMPFDASSDLWTPRHKNFVHVSEGELWYGFCQHIKHSRRFILAEDVSIDPMSDPRDWLPDLLPSVEKVLAAGTVMCRARPNEIGKTTEPYTASEMEAPPIEKTIAGRISPAGIRVLYAALERETAVSEVRPEKGAVVTVATIRTRKELKLVDLTSVPIIPSPFGHSEESLAELIERNGFLQCVNEALSRPVRKQEAEIEYVPTQYVAEVIKNARYDGIIYKSSLAEGGQNVVIFDPSVAEVEPKTELVLVTSVVIKYESL